MAVKHAKQESKVAKLCVNFERWKTLVMLLELLES